MNATREIAIYHFKREVLKKGYLLTLLSLPLFLALVIGLGSLTASYTNTDTLIGVVDPAGFIKSTIIPGDEGDIKLVFFETEKQASEALLAEQPLIAGFFVLPSGYPEEKEVDLFYINPLSRNEQRYFQDILRVNLLAGNSDQLIDLVISGGELLIHATEVNRVFPRSNPSLSLFIPLIIGVIFVFTIFPIVGIMMGALSDEKFNRTIEVILTSVSPSALITGKVLAVASMAILQVMVWIGFFALGIWIGGQFFEIRWMQGVIVPWRDVGAIALVAVPSFIFYAATLVLIGSLIEEKESIQQAGGFIFIPLFLPLYIVQVLIEQPTSVLAMVFEFLPFTSVLTIGMQSIFLEIPTWQIFASAGVAWLSAAAMTSLAGRAFRKGMLRYGQRVRLRELFLRAAA